MAALDIGRWVAPNQPKAYPWLRAVWDHLSNFLDSDLVGAIDTEIADVRADFAAADAVVAQGLALHTHLDGTGGVAPLSSTPTTIPGVTWTSPAAYERVVLIVTVHFNITATGTDFARAACYRDGVQTADGDQVFLTGAVLEQLICSASWSLDSVTNGEVIDIRGFRGGAGGTYNINTTHNRAELFAFVNNGGT